MIPYPAKRSASPSGTRPSCSISSAHVFGSRIVVTPPWRRVCVQPGGLTIGRTSDSRWQNLDMQAARPADLSQAELLAILSLATDLGVGLPAEHGLRACYIGLRLAEATGVGRAEQ